MQNGLESRSQDTAAKLLCYKGEEDCLKNFYSTNHPPFQNLIIQYLFIKIWKCIMILFPPNAAGLHTHMYSKDKLDMVFVELAMLIAHLAQNIYKASSYKQINFPIY